MDKYVWPISMLENCKIDTSTMVFLDAYAREAEKTHQKLSDLHEEHELLKSTSAKQDRYIAELEKQLNLLQKTLDLIDTKGVREDG